MPRIPAASAVSMPIVSGDFGRWVSSIASYSTSDQLGILQVTIEKKLRNDSSCSDPACTAQQATGDILQTLHQKFDSQKTQLKEKITATLDGLKNQPDIMFSHLTFSNVSQKFDEFNQLKLNSNSSSSANQLTNLYGLIKSIHDAKASLPKSKNKTLNELEENIKKYARVKLWCDTKDSMAPAAAASANPNPDQEKFFEQLETQRHGLTSTANVLHHAEESMKNTLQTIFRTDSTENQIATMSSNMLEIAKKMDEERDKINDKIDSEHTILQTNVQNLQTQVSEAQKNIQNEINELNKKINDPSVADATQKQIAQERVPKLQVLLEQIKIELAPVEKSLEAFSRKMDDLEIQKNPVLFEKKLAETQVAMRDSENALKQAQKSILNTTNERLYEAAISFLGENVASTFQTAAKNTAIPAEAQEAFQTLATTASQVQEQCKVLLTLESKTITKEARELYRAEYQNTLDQMNKSLTEIATQIKSQFNTLKYACEGDKVNCGNAFDALRSLDDEVYKQRKHMMGMFESAKMIITEKRETHKGTDGIDRPRVANPAANPDTVSGEDLGRGFEIYYYERKDPYDKTSPLEKTYAKDKNGDHLNLSIKEIEQLVAKINQQRVKDGKELVDLKIKNKGNDRYSFTIDCHDKQTKEEVIKEMVAVQNKRVEELAKTAGPTSIKIANLANTATAAAATTSTAVPAAAVTAIPVVTAAAQANGGNPTTQRLQGQEAQHHPPTT